MGSFYSRLSYSFGNEDWETEQKALKIQENDEILCVTASGDRPLNLLSTSCKSITSIDANPFQSALCELKKTAISELDYENYLAFLGERPHNHRLETYKRLEKHLTPASAKLWNKHPKKIRDGVLYNGDLERKLKFTSAFLHLFRGKKITKLFSFDNLEEQAEFVDKEWDSPMWKKAFEVVLHPRVTRIFLKDPGLYEYAEEKHIGKHIYKQFNEGFKSCLAKESILSALLFKGRVHPVGHPPYLTEEGFSKIKPQIDSLNCKTLNLIEYLHQVPEGSYDCFSASDIASYMTQEGFDELVRGVLRAAKPGARFCFRQFLSNHKLPEEIAHHFKRDEALEEELRQQDRCFVYKFMTGVVEKG